VIVAIHQPNYLPWLGYFHKIKMADVFIFLDHVQIPGKGLANKNYIKGKDGNKVLLTVPLKRLKGMHSSYNESVPDYAQQWQKEHLNKITDAYRKAPYFEQMFPLVESLLMMRYDNLSMMNMAIIKSICNQLGIHTQLRIASALSNNKLHKNERNIDLVKQVGGNIYLSGQGAKKYNDEAIFAHHEINMTYQSFEVPTYNQIGEVFMAQLSVIDLLFNVDLEDIARMLSHNNG
jgi:hypothetical protein